eukprot:scaffold123657_cov57-Phaeocystis_antarctica.AAC.1
MSRSFSNDCQLEQRLPGLGFRVRGWGQGWGRGQGHLPRQVVEGGEVRSVHRLRHQLLPHLHSQYSHGEHSFHTCNRGIGVTAFTMYSLCTHHGRQREGELGPTSYLLPTYVPPPTDFLPTHCALTIEGSESESCVSFYYSPLTMCLPWRAARARVASPSDEAPSRAAARRNIATRAAAEMAPRSGVGVG